MATLHENPAIIFLRFVQFAVELDGFIREV
jgi:hypothetical protein